MKLKRALSWVIAALTVMGARTAFAQATTPAPRASEYESRADLEAQLQQAEAQHRASEAFLLKNRLGKGDFQEGDRIVVMLHSTAAAQLAETLTVRTGRKVQMPRMDDLSLDGVLRSELTDRFEKYLAKYLRDYEVRTTPLMRISVLGAVGRPGFQDVAADLLLSDVIMRSGGPASDADLSNVIIRRGTTVIWDAKDTRTALTDNMSLDRLHLRAGDEVEVGAKRHIQWFNLISVSLGIVTLAVTLIRLR